MNWSHSTYRLQEWPRSSLSDLNPTRSRQLYRSRSAMESGMCNPGFESLRHITPSRLVAEVRSGQPYKVVQVYHREEDYSVELTLLSQDASSKLRIGTSHVEIHSSLITSMSFILLRDVVRIGLPLKWDEAPCIAMSFFCLSCHFTIENGVSCALTPQPRAPSWLSAVMTAIPEVSINNHSNIAPSECQKLR